MHNNTREYPITRKIFEAIIAIALFCRLIPIANLFYKLFSKITGTNLSPSLESRFRKNISRKRDYDFVFHLTIIGLFKVIFHRLNDNLLKLNFYIQRKIKRLLASRILLLILKPLTQVFAAMAAMFLLYKISLYGYYKYNNDHVSAEVQKKNIIDLLNQGFSSVKSHCRKFMEKVFSGGIVAAVQILASILISIILKPFVTLFDNRDPIQEADFTDAVFYAPIVEEFVYRGIVLNIFNAVYNWVNPVVKEEYVAQDRPVTSIGAAINVVCSLEKNILSERNLEKNITTMPNLAVALLFADAHSESIKNGAFVKGLIFGGLTTKDEGDITSSVAAHMTNNFMVWCLYKL